MFRKFTLIAAAAVTLAACGAGSTIVVDPYEGEKRSYQGAVLANNGSTIEVPAEIVEKFQKSMDKQFHEKGVFEREAGLQVKYTFVQFEAGNQFSRWFFGGIGNAGEASLTVKVDFETPEGEHLSTINVSGKIGSGFFGGSVSSALDKAAGEAAEYAAAQYR